MKMTKQKQVLYKKTKRMNEELLNEICKIKDSEGLTAENIVKVAKNKNNVLHKFFDWNDNSASDKYRLFQARQLINEVKIIIEEREYFAFENVSVQINEGGKLKSKKLYLDRTEIMNNKDLREQILNRAMGNIQYWRRQHGAYEELNPIFEGIDVVEKKLKNGN